MKTIDALKLIDGLYPNWPLNEKLHYFYKHYYMKKHEHLFEDLYDEYNNKKPHYSGPIDGILHDDNIIFSKEEFINKLKIDEEFAKKQGLKIEERILTLEERKSLITEHDFIAFGHLIPFTEKIITMWLNGKKYPTKQITLTYKDEIIQYYE